MVKQREEREIKRKAQSVMREKNNQSQIIIRLKERQETGQKSALNIKTEHEQLKAVKEPESHKISLFKSPLKIQPNYSTGEN